MEMLMHGDKWTLGLGVLLIVVAGCSNSADSQRSKQGHDPAAAASEHRFLVDDGDTRDSTATDECVVNVEGTQDCVWDDGLGTTCDYTVSGDGGTLLSEQCVGPWGSYTCAGNGTTIDCTFTSVDGSECTDEWSVDGELVGTTCDYGREPTTDDCQAQDDGTLLCTYGDEITTCTERFDAEGQFLSGECTDGVWTQVCETVENIVHCSLYERDQLLCEDTWTIDGEPISLGCEAYMPTEPSDPGCTDPSCGEPPMTCEAQADGGQICTQSDGEVTCVSTYDANGVPLAVTCTNAAGQVLYLCETDPGDALLHCVYDDGRQSCEDVIDPRTGEPVSSTCAEDQGRSTP
jgi:hypothetical protein